jgi:hypothetical protein
MATSTNRTYRALHSALFYCPQGKEQGKTPGVLALGYDGFAVKRGFDDAFGCLKQVAFDVLFATVLRASVAFTHGT